jgi:hypothetical protein
VDKQQLLKQLEKAWQDFQQAYAGLSEEQLTTPGVAGEWSVRDVIAHVTTWEDEALKYLPVILKGEKPPRYSAMYGGIAAFNAKMTKEKEALSLAEVQRQMNETHFRLVHFVESAPDDQFQSETRFRRRLRLDTYSHYPIHAKAIRRWRERMFSTASA